MRDLVVIVDKSAGNESVGEMWQETKIFPADTKLEDVMNWAMYTARTDEHSRSRITLTLPHPTGE